jgi:hypothetical protein
MPAAAHERNLLEAWLHGQAVILTLVAATVAIVLTLTVCCGTGLTWEHAGMIAVLLLAAGSCELFARLARTSP